MAIVGRIVAIDGESAVVDFKNVSKKVSNKLGIARLNDFVIVKGDLVIERLESSEGKKLFSYQAALVRKLHSKKFKA